MVEVADIIGLKDADQMMGGCYGVAIMVFGDVIGARNMGAGLNNVLVHVAPVVCHGQKFVAKIEPAIGRLHVAVCLNRILRGREAAPPVGDADVRHLLRPAGDGCRGAAQGRKIALEVSKTRRLIA